jgi:hypothetical protein
MSKPAENQPNQSPRKRGIPRASAVAEPLPRHDDAVGPPYYVALTTKDGWQLLLEHADVYLRWELRGAPGNGGQALPGIDVARSSLEGERGTPTGKPALEREGNEIGRFHNLRERGGEMVAFGECLADGHFELEFDGELMSGRWRLARSGMSRREQETWTLTRLPPAADEA